MFDDVKHIEVIRRALWSRQPFSQAAVMVGSGFSRNAEIPLGSSPPPLWSDLAVAFYRALGKRGQRESITDMQENLEARAKGPLRLAQEYEATFGRKCLDELLQTYVRDKQYSPGRNHDLLLGLPWTDVLTTNFDTLLERASPVDSTRRYELVVTQDDISHARRPRIVKLHGTLPSNRPFIITEEDFRTYPACFAAFVNLAQQTIMENVVCLLGFSGDDSNFLSWTGWVRDHLGCSAPKIYMCGLLDVSDSERMLLDRRNVIPIDLSPRFTASTFPDAALRHRLALEWFLLSLYNGRQPEPWRWPHTFVPEVLYSKHLKPSQDVITALPPPYMEPQATQEWPNGK